MTDLTIILEPIRAAINAERAKEKLLDPWALARQIAEELSKGAGEVVPVAWIYELATHRNLATKEYSVWEERITKHHPNVPPESIRNVRALYATPPAPEPAPKSVGEYGEPKPVAWMWEEMVDPTGEVINGKTIQRVAFHWSTPPKYLPVTPLYLADAIEALEAERDICKREWENAYREYKVLLAERDAIEIERRVWVAERDRLTTENQALQQRVAELEGERDSLRAALDCLLRAAVRVSQLGAIVGPQWSALTTGIIRARAALHPTPEAKKEGE